MRNFVLFVVFVILLGLVGHMDYTDEVKSVEIDRANKEAVIKQMQIDCFTGRITDQTVCRF